MPDVKNKIIENLRLVAEKNPSYTIVEILSDATYRAVGHTEIPLVKDEELLWALGYMVTHDAPLGRI